jgi:hypothetical protein
VRLRDLLAPGAWGYLLSPLRDRHYPGTSPAINWLRAIWCRWRGHPEGVWWFNAGGSEPDMHCKGCGDDLG